MVPRCKRDAKTAFVSECLSRHSDAIFVMHLPGYKNEGTTATWDSHSWTYTSRTMLHYLLLWIFVISSEADPIVPGGPRAGSAGLFKTHEAKSSDGQRGTSYIFHTQGQQAYVAAGTSPSFSSVRAPPYQQAPPQLLATSGTTGSSAPAPPHTAPAVATNPPQAAFVYPQSYNLQAPHPYAAYPSSTVEYASPRISQSASPPNGYAPQGFVAAHQNPQTQPPSSVLPQSAHYAQPIYYTGSSTGTSAHQATAGTSAAPPSALVHAGITYVPAPGQVGQNDIAYTLPAGYPSGQPSPPYATYALPPTRSQQKTEDLNVPSDYYAPSSYPSQAPGVPSGASVYSQPPPYYAQQAVNPTQVSQPASLSSPFQVYGRSQISPEALYRYYVPHTGHPSPGLQQTQPVAPSVQPTYPAGAALVRGFPNNYAGQHPSVHPSALYRSFADLGYTGASIYGTPMYSKASPGPNLSKYVSPRFYTAAGAPTRGAFSYTLDSLRDTRAAAAALGHDGSTSRPYVVGASSYEVPTYAEAFAVPPRPRFASLQASSRGVRYVKKK